MKFNKLALTMLLASGVMSANTAMATQLDSSFNVKLAISALCKIDTINDVDFGLVDSNTATATKETDLSITCNDTQPYSIALKPSNGDADGKGIMTGAVNSATIPYTMYADAGTTTPFSVNAPVAGTGSGNAITHKVYVKVDGSEFNKPADHYLDVVSVSITY